MHSLWHEKTRQQAITRLQRLTPNSKAKWGRMNAAQMVAHLSDALRMASGELSTTPRNLAIRYPPLKQLIVYWLPFPKNLPTATELISREPGPWEQETMALVHEVEQFGRRNAGNKWPRHPAFGKLSTNAWGVLAYRHIDHHFRQFGI